LRRNRYRLWRSKINRTTVADRAEGSNLSNLEFAFPATRTWGVFKTIATYCIGITLQEAVEEAALRTLAPLKDARITRAAEAASGLDAMRLQHSPATFVA
jgi:hypothetical protein